MRSEKLSANYVNRDHLDNYIICDIEDGMQLKYRRYLSLISTIEPKNFSKPYGDESWEKAVNDELKQIEKSGTREFVPIPIDKNVINTKWVFKNKLNEEEILFEIKPD